MVNLETITIPKKWNIVNLKKKTTKIGSGITPRGGEKVYKKEGRPFVRSQNIGWGNLVLDDIAFIDEKTHHLFNSTEIMADDVLLNITGASIGRSAIADSRIKNGNVNQHVCIIRTDSQQLIPFYLNNFLLSKIGQDQISMFQAGGNREGLNFGQIGSIQILFPIVIEEQEKICHVLYDISKFVNKIEQSIEKKKNIKQGIMQKLLTGEKRLAGFGKKWISKELDEICLKIGDGIHSTPKYTHNSNIFFINGNNLIHDTIKISNNTKCVNESELKKHGRSLEKNTILMSINGTIGNLALYKDEVVILGKSIAYIQLEKTIETKFIFYLLHMPIIRDFYKNELTGTTIRNLSLKSIRKTPIVYPEDPKEQLAIANILSDMDSEIKEFEEKRDKYIKIKNGMMQKLLTGEIRLA